MYVAFFGTGNALPSAERANTSLGLVARSGAGVTLIDCGGDPYRSLRRAGVSDPNRVNAVVITHAHIDHIAGLPSLIESLRITDRTAPLPIYAVAHPLGIVRELLRVFAFELTLDRWPFAVELHEVTPGEPITIGDFTATATMTQHSVPSAGYRFAVKDDPAGTVFAYTSDTMIAPQLSDIARDAALFVAEATYPKGKEDEARQVCHMTAEQAANVAKAGGARTLGLVHLSVPPRQERGVKHEARQTFGGEVLIPHDDMVIEVGRRIRVAPKLP